MRFRSIEKHRARKYKKGIRTFSGNRGKCAIQIVGAVHSNKSKVHSQGQCRLLCFVHHVIHRALAIGAGMPERGHLRSRG